MSKKNKSKKCGFCKNGSWIFPALIILLIWVWPKETWSQIICTIAAFLTAIQTHCNCQNK